MALGRSNTAIKKSIAALSEQVVRYAWPSSIRTPFNILLHFMHTCKGRDCSKSRRFIFRTFPFAVATTEDLGRL